MNYLYEALEKPTRLYIKQCGHCGLKYFGKTVSKNIEKYQGSGLYWTRHLKQHNVKADHLWNSDWYYDTSIIRFALKFSYMNNIAESKEWANLGPENGINGGVNNGTIDSNRKRLESGTHNFLDPEFLKENNRKRLESGTHNFLDSEFHKKYVIDVQNKMVKDGTHCLLSGEIQRKQCLDMVEAGTHPFLGGEVSRKTNEKRLKEGTHNFVTNNPSASLAKQGKHHFQTNNPQKVKWKCDVTGKVSNKSGFTRMAKNRGLLEWPHSLTPYP